MESGTPTSVKSRFRQPWREWIPTRVHVILGVMGFVTAIVAAIGSYKQFPSAWLAFFVFAQTFYLTGRGLADVIVLPHRIQRAIYYLLLPTISAAVVYEIYLLWGHMWIAVILGLIIGGMLHSLITYLLLPRITHEKPPDGPIDLHEERWRAPEPESIDTDWIRKRHPGTTI